MLSSTVNISTGAPQGCVLSPCLYSLFTSDCKTTDNSTHIVKFADDTTICGFISGNNETKYRAQIETTVNWCRENNLLLNVSKTKELIVDFRKYKNTKDPLVINGQEVNQVSSFKFLGTHIADNMKWQENTADICKKARQRLYFLRTLDSFNLNRNILVSFCRSTIKSILTRSFLVWYKAASQKDLSRLNSIIRTAEKITHTSLPSLEKLYQERTLKRTLALIKDTHHPACNLFVFLRSGKRLRTFMGNKRFTTSFYPAAVHIFNSNH